MLVHQDLKTNTHENSHFLLHTSTHRHWSLVSLLVTCNYVAMMSLIFCIGWKPPDAERLGELESAALCGILIRSFARHWLNGKCFSLLSPCLCLPPQSETEGKTGRLTSRSERADDWQADSALTDTSDPGCLTSREIGPGALSGQRGRGENKQEGTLRNDTPVHGQKKY